jgi:tRNA(adenine34) deaminase
MRELAESWGDQSYGAVVVIGEKVVGFGPSRVVKDQDLNAHAERVATGEAQRVSGQRQLEGAVLYSTSLPCRACEAAAARAGIQRMFYGPRLEDAGAPRP